MINSYYEVEYQGEKYYCNIHLMPYHTFRYDGTIYVLNVERMNGYKISENFSKVLDKISTNPNIPVIRTIIEELNKLELINETPSSQGDDRSKKRDVVATLNEMPVHAIALNVAQSCNMKCVYCFGNGGEYGEEGFMEEETALRTVDWLIDNSKDSKQISITFFGGEPLMNFPLIQRVVEYAKKKQRRDKKVSDLV